MKYGFPDIGDLSLEERIGQLLCFGWQSDESGPATSFNDHARSLIERLHVGAVVLLGRNISTIEETKQLVQQIRAASPIPLLVAIDQEGGSVNRIGPPFHQFPGNMALGAVAYGSGLATAADLTRKQATAQARELLNLGINWNFAPVLDVNNNPDNPIIGVRSYGEDPKIVARLGAAAIEGYQRAGLMACGKHFPGHGDTSIDSHLALPSIEGSRQRLENLELVPFKEAIKAGVSSIMTTHIVFKALDNERPATLSTAVISGLLRKELAFDGLVVTDCLEMDAVARTGGTPRAAVEALKAGADVALVCHTLETQIETRDAISNAVKSGGLPEGLLNEAVSRVIKAKANYCNDRTPETGSAEATDKLEAEIAGNSITILRTNGYLPLKLEQGTPLHVYSMHPIRELFGAILSGMHEIASSVNWSPVLGSNAKERALEIAINAARPGGFGIVLTTPREPWSKHPIDQEIQVEFVSALHAIYGGRLIVDAIREPYDLRQFPEVENYICSYGYNECSLRALARVLLGDAPAGGRLPVSIPGLNNRETVLA